MKTILVKNVSGISKRNVKVLALSLLYAHLWYDDVELYTDELGYNIFRDFPVKVIKHNFSGYREILESQTSKFMFINYDFIGSKPIDLTSVKDYVVSVSGKGVKVNYLYVNNVIGFANSKTYDKSNKIKNKFNNLKGFNSVSNSILAKYLTTDNIDKLLKECFNYWNVILKKRIKLFYGK